MIAISIALTVVITVIMFKVDVGKLLDKVFKREQFNKQLNGEQS